MRLVFEDHEKQPILEQAVEAEEAGKPLLAASLRGIAENGMDLSRDWESMRVELFEAHGIDVTGNGGDARVA
ncbi:hypothetical protein ABZV67_37425 [Streptomyces sp. NPDC005065]|uniref:hypothetical protein n=1 Tax=Streptomyces sp. NPDC005065 TaxID=3154461 RepID=UPI0033AB973B